MGLLCVLRSAAPRSRIQQARSAVAWKSSTTAEAATALWDDGAVPTLQHIPALPLLGSFVPAYSGIPKMDQSKIFEFWPELRRRYGDFYTIGIPGFGCGAKGTLHVIQDPNEMVKILRHEGKYPSGAAEFQFPMIKYFRENPTPAGNGLVSRGPEWKRVRNFVQTDLLSPTSAKRYLPAVIEAAQYSSRGAPVYGAEGRLNDYLVLASFDMFSNIMMGSLPRASDPTVETSPEDLSFSKVVPEALSLLVLLSTNTYEVIMAKLGVKTKAYKEFCAAWSQAFDIARQKTLRIKKKRDANELSEREENCYANQAFHRQEQDGEVTIEEATNIAAGLIAAGVDTTAGMLSWKLLHVASSPEAQDRIYYEIQKNGGSITPESMAPSNSPYLYAALRESHRLANPNITIPMKEIPKELEVHGVRLPEKSAVVLDGYSQGVDPNLVDDPLEFRPERFLEDAVKARKGTPSEVIDHVLFSSPFSQGARRCPASRVANYEAAVFLSQLVQDWEISVDGVKHWTDVPYSLKTVTTATLPPMKFSARSGN